VLVVSDESKAYRLYDIEATDENNDTEVADESNDIEAADENTTEENTTP